MCLYIPKVSRETVGDYNSFDLANMLTTVTVAFHVFLGRHENQEWLGNVDQGKLKGLPQPLSRAFSHHFCTANTNV
jgi:hypothetical protein